MAAKKTIAIVGADKKTGIAIAKKLSQSDYRLLLISEDANQLTQIGRFLKRKSLTAQAEVIDCVRDGCWEADIIILFSMKFSEKEILEKIKEVATQKIVVSISDRYISLTSASVKQLQVLLPYSKVVNLFNDPSTTEVYLTAADNEAVQTISNLVRSAGFNPIVIRDTSKTNIKLSNI